MTWEKLILKLNTIPKAKLKEKAIVLSLNVETEIKDFVLTDLLDEADNCSGGKTYVLIS